MITTNQKINQPKLQFYNSPNVLANFGCKNFIINQENRDVVNNLTIFLETNFSSLFSNIFAITGPSNCGKTHLSIFTLKKLGYKFELINNKPIETIEPNSIYFFDDCNFQEKENSLLEFINFANENNAKVIITTKEIGKINLKDLNSRIKNSYKGKLTIPSPAFVKEIFYNETSYLQIKVEKKIIDKIIQENCHHKNLLELLMLQIKL